jgi:hypothetical protein
VPIIQLALSGKTLSEAELYDYGIYRIRQQIAPVRRLHEEIGLADCPGLGIDLLTEEVDLGRWIDGPADKITIPPRAQGDVLLGDREHST